MLALRNSPELNRKPFAWLLYPLSFLVMHYFDVVLQSKVQPLPDTTEIHPERLEKLLSDVLVRYNKIEKRRLQFLERVVISPHLTFDVPESAKKLLSKTFCEHTKTSLDHPEKALNALARFIVKKATMWKTKEEREASTSFACFVRAVRPTTTSDHDHDNICCLVPVAKDFQYESILYNIPTAAPDPPQYTRKPKQQQQPSSSLRIEEEEEEEDIVLPQHREMRHPFVATMSRSKETPDDMRRRIEHLEEALKLNIAEKWELQEKLSNAAVKIQKMKAQMAPSPAFTLGTRKQRVTTDEALEDKMRIETEQGPHSKPAASAFDASYINQEINRTYIDKVKEESNDDNNNNTTDQTVDLSTLGLEDDSDNGDE